MFLELYVVFVFTSAKSSLIPSFSVCGALVPPERQPAVLLQVAGPVVGARRGDRAGQPRGRRGQLRHGQHLRPQPPQRRGARARAAAPRLPLRRRAGHVAPRAGDLRARAHARARGHAAGEAGGGLGAVSRPGLLGTRCR